MSTIAKLTSRLTVTEMLSGNRPFAADAKAAVIHDLLDQVDVTVTPVTKVAGFQKALAAGVATIDLTALVGTNGQAVDGTGLRVEALKVRNPLANANPITIKIGASNGYDGFGTTFALTLAPGATALLKPLDAGSDIGATKKTLDLTGTLVQALDVLVVLG